MIGLSRNGHCHRREILFWTFWKKRTGLSLTRQFADRAGYTTKHVSQLVRGKAAITEDTALRLERVLGSTAEFWLSREAKYREAIARAEERKRLESETEWLKELPLREMIKFGWVKKCSEKIEQVSECLKYFGFASVSAWRSKYPLPSQLAAFKSSEKYEKKPGAVAAWLRRGEQIAERRPCEKYDSQGFLAKLQTFRDHPLQMKSNRTYLFRS